MRVVAGTVCQGSVGSRATISCTITGERDQLIAGGQRHRQGAGKKQAWNYQEPGAGNTKALQDRQHYLVWHTVHAHTNYVLPLSPGCFLTNT